MRKTEPLRKLAQMKKDARLAIRVARELKAKIKGIDRIYGVALPKIANGCLRAFCTYVEQKKRTPTFPLCISPHSPDDKTPNNVATSSTTRPIRIVLNEFLKEHRTVKEQQKEIDALKSELREQKSLIEKVSAQLEASKLTQQVVANDQ